MSESISITEFGKFQNIIGKESFPPRTHWKVSKLFLILSCILNFSFDCISNKLCTHWCCIKCCEHQHKGLGSQIKNYVFKWILPNRTGIDRSNRSNRRKELFLTCRNQEKWHCIISSWISFCFSLVRESSMVRLNSVRSNFGLLMTGF